MTFLVLVIVATTIVVSSCSKLKKQGARNGETLGASLDFCDLVRSPESYDSKTVRVLSVLIGYHELALYSASCDNQIRYIRADLDSNSRNQLLRGVANLSGPGMHSGNFWVGVIVVGRFERFPNPIVRS